MQEKAIEMAKKLVSGLKMANLNTPEHISALIKVISERHDLSTDESIQCVKKALDDLSEFLPKEK